MRTTSLNSDTIFLELFCMTSQPLLNTFAGLAAQGGDDTMVHGSMERTPSHFPLLHYACC